MLNSVRTRLTLWYIGVLAVVLVAFSVGVYSVLKRNTERRVDTELQRAMEGTTALFLLEMGERELEIAARKAQPPGGGDDDDEASVEPIESTYELAQAVLRDRYLSNQSSAISDSTHVIAQQILPGDGPLELTGRVSDMSDGLDLFTESGPEVAAGYERRIAVRKVTIPASGAFAIVLSQSLRPVKQELGALREIFYFAVPIALVLAGLGGWFLARKSLSPVVKMSDAARRMGADHLERRLPVANPRDELGQLAVAFNELLSRLDSAFAQQRQFMADASHELRTPLSVMNTTSQVMLERSSRSEAEYRDALTIMAEQTKQLVRIVEDMFTLARADAGRRELQKTTFYIDELLGETVHAGRVLANCKGVTVAFAQSEEAPCFGDEELVREMLLNLLDNAIRHTPAGGTVSVELSHRDSSYLVTVADSGEGIPPEAQPHIFERFYRVDKARTRGSGANGGGAGLGLPIARWIAEAHGGSLDLLGSDRSGSAFVATLPINRAESKS